MLLKKKDNETQKHPFVIYPLICPRILIIFFPPAEEGEKIAESDFSAVLFDPVSPGRTRPLRDVLARHSRWDTLGPMRAEPRPRAHWL